VADSGCAGRSSRAEQKAVDEVDHSLIDWYRGMSMIERLRAASRSAAVLERLARAAANR